MPRFIRSTLRPAAFHAGKPPFFEGWYYKLADRTGQHRFAVIPGVFLHREDGKSHAFVQIFDGATGDATYHEYPVEEFRAVPGELDIRIGLNHFTAHGISLQLAAADRTARGELCFEGVTPWPVTLWSPGIMGWYAWVPFMECYHGVVSLDHSLAGSLAVDGVPIDFTGGRGYTEKDWGRSFPAAWVWFQTNHFDPPGASLTASLALIPWVRRTFPGFIIGLWLGGRLYRFATYTGARVERLEIGDERVVWVVRDRRYRLEMTVHRAEGGILRAPSISQMDRRIAETMKATVEVRLFRLGAAGPSLLFSGAGKYAGLEAHGDLPRLLRAVEGMVRTTTLPDAQAV